MNSKNKISTREHASSHHEHKNAHDVSSRKTNVAKKPEATSSHQLWQILKDLKQNDEPRQNSSVNLTAQEIICKSCKKSGFLVEDPQTSTIVCENCGMVNEALFDLGPEWRQYNNDEGKGDSNGRCGCPTNYFFPKSSQGTIMAGMTNNRLRQKEKWNSMIYKERSLNNVFETIANICSRSQIPKIIADSAKILYKNLSDCKHKTGPNAGKQIIIRGENRNSIIAACIFKACEMNGNARSIKEIAKYCEIDEKRITRGIKHFDKLIKNSDYNISTLEQDVPDTAKDFIERFCPKLGISKANTCLAVTIATNCCRMKLASDHNQQSIAAGAILVMADYQKLIVDKKNITVFKKRIADLFETSDVTISKIYNKIEPYVDGLVDDAITDHLIKKFKING